jgi:hypothetical protein
MATEVTLALTLQVLTALLACLTTAVCLASLRLARRQLTDALAKLDPPKAQVVTASTAALASPAPPAQLEVKAPGASASPTAAPKAPAQCPHCGAPLPPVPRRSHLADGKASLVFWCEACQREAYFPLS